jgi:hypothetical protein
MEKMVCARSVLILLWIIYIQERGFLMANGSLILQFNNKLKSMRRFGQSRHKNKIEIREIAKLTGEKHTNRADGIYSHITYENYKQHVMLFARYLKEDNIGIKNINQITPKIAHKYLEKLQNEKGYRAATIQTKSAAIAKVLNLHCNDINYGLKTKCSELPEKGRKYTNTITDKNRDLKDFMNKTGCRSSESRQIKPEQIKINRKGKVFLDFKSKKEYREMTKGGRGREITEIADIYQSQLLAIKKTAEEKNYDRVWQTVSDSAFKHLNGHQYRREYAQNLYRKKEQEYINKFGYQAKHDYVCRKFKGESYNRKILQEISEQLGHNRIDVVINNYFR